MKNWKWFGKPLLVHHFNRKFLDMKRYWISSSNQRRPVVSFPVSHCVFSKISFYVFLCFFFLPKVFCFWNFVVFFLKCNGLFNIILIFYLLLWSLKCFFFYWTTQVTKKLLLIWFIFYFQLWFPVSFSFIFASCFSCRYVLTELVETERLYVEDLGLIVQVRFSPDCS